MLYDKAQIKYRLYAYQLDIAGESFMLVGMPPEIDSIWSRTLKMYLLATINKVRVQAKDLLRGLMGGSEEIPPMGHIESGMSY